jgi:hypothetical protein
MIRQSARRIAIAAGAALALTAAAQAAPASADPNFGAGNLPPMEITEGGSLDYAVSFPPCPAGYDCQLVTYLTDGIAKSPSDYVNTHVGNGKWFHQQDGPMVMVQPIQTVDDTVHESDEPLFMNARVDYFRSGCPNVQQANPDCWPPESSMRWSGIVTIDDNDKTPRKLSVRQSPASKVAPHLSRVVTLPAHP